MEEQRARARAEDGGYTQVAGLPERPPPTSPPWLGHLGPGIVINGGSLPSASSSAASQGGIYLGYSRKFQAHVHQTRAASSASLPSGTRVTPVPLSSEVRPTNQSSYAAELLHGNDGAGILHVAFTEAIKRDIAKHSNQS